MRPQSLRVVLVILAVRAIFISPAQGSEYGSTYHPGDSALKRLDAIRPARLRFTKPFAPSASQERIDCLDGGDGDDERISLAAASVDDRFWAVYALVPHLSHPSILATPRSLVRLRC